MRSYIRVGLFFVSFASAASLSPAQTVGERCGRWLLDHDAADVWAFEPTGSQRLSSAINMIQWARYRQGLAAYPKVSELLRQSRFDRRDHQRQPFSVNIVDTLRLLAQTMAPNLESDVTLWRLTMVEPHFRRPEIIEVNSFRPEHWQIGSTGAKLIFGEFTHPDRTPNSFGLFLVLSATPTELTVIDAMSKDMARGELRLRDPLPRRGLKLTTFDYRLDQFPVVAHFTPYTITALDLRSPVVVDDQWNPNSAKAISVENLEIEFGDGRDRARIWSTSQGHYQIRLGDEVIAPAKLIVANEDGRLMRLVFNVPYRSVVLAEPFKRNLREHTFVEHYSITLLKDNLSIGSVRRFYIDTLTREEYAWPGAASYNRIHYPVRRSTFRRRVN